MTKDELRSVLPGGKNHEVATKWANDDKAVLQARCNPAESFYDVRTPNFRPELEWRIKPEVLKYRVAVMETYRGPYNVMVTTSFDKDYMEKQPEFVRWVSDWQEVEV